MVRANDAPKICARAVFVYVENFPFSYHLFFSYSLSPVSLESSRKRFFAKLLGLVALGGLAPKIVGRILAGRETGTVDRPRATLTLRSEPRAVARRPESI